MIFKDWRIIPLILISLLGNVVYADSLNCKLVGNWPAGSSYAVTIDQSRNLCFVSSGGNVYILDVSNPSHLTKLSEIHTKGLVKDLFFLDNSLYTVDDGKALGIWDLSDPLMPIKLGEYLFTSGEPTAVKVQGSYAYVTIDLSLLLVIDVSNPSLPIEAGYCFTGEPTLDVYVSGVYAYVATYDSGLRIIDISNPSSPYEVGYYNQSRVIGVYALGQYVYATTEEHALSIIDVSNPSSPFQVSFVDAPGTEKKVFVSDSYAYVTVGQFGLRIIDISTPYSPIEVGYYRTEGECYGVCAYDHKVYLANVTEGLIIINVPNLSLLSEVGHYDTQGDALDVDINGSYAYVADGLDGLRIIDISNPSLPSEVGHCDTPGNAQSVFVFNSYAYVADGDYGLRIINISNPSSPFEVGYYDTPGCAHDVYLSGSYAYIADDSKGLRIVDISNPSSPIEVGYYETTEYVYGVYVSGSYVYLTVPFFHSALIIIDASTPASPYEIGYYDGVSYASKVYVVGSYAYIADGNLGLKIVDVSNPSDPYEVGHIYNMTALDVFVSGSYAYVVDDIYGLRVIDISNPHLPAEVGSYEIAGSHQKIDVVGSLAFVTSGETGFSIINIPAQSLTSCKGHYSVASLTRGIFVKDSLLYLANSNGLKIVNVSNPLVPYELSHFDTPYAVNAVYVSGSYAYLAEGQCEIWGIRIIDISNPLKPFQVGYFKTYSTPCDEISDIYVSGSYAYLADQIEGLRIIDISNPSSPFEVGHDNTIGALAVYVDGSYAYVASGGNGLRIINISNPSSPVEVGFYDTNCNAYGVRISGSYAYVADNGSGLKIIDISNPSSPFEVSSSGVYGTDNYVFASEPYAYIANPTYNLEVIDVSNPSSPFAIGYYLASGISGVYVSNSYIYVANGSNGVTILTLCRPTTPEIVSISDEGSCSQYGVSITFTAGTPSTRNDLYMDGVLVLSGVTSPVNYFPGDFLQHGYFIRSVNEEEYCYADSGVYYASDSPNNITAPIYGPFENQCPSALVLLTTETSMTDYQWYKDGKAILGENSDHYLVSEAGSYKVTYKESSGCIVYSLPHDVTLVSCIPNIIFDENSSFTEVTGDGDSYFEKGEKWKVGVTVRNSGNTPATNVVANLTGNGIQVCNNPGVFGTIPAGGTASYEFEFLIDYNFSPCGGYVDFGLINKQCFEKTPAGNDEFNLFSIQVGEITSGVPTEVVIDATEDSWVNQALMYADTNYGSDTSLYSQQRTSQARRALIQFGLSAIPSGSVINSATLEMYATSATGNPQINLHRVTSSWTESGVTWNNQPSYDAAIVSSLTSSGTGWKVWDVKSLIEGYLNGTYTNDGILLKCNTETGTTTVNKVFASRENSNTSQRPVLRINYTPPPAMSCNYVGNGECLIPLPEEVAPGDNYNNALIWSEDKAAINWPAVSGVTSYKVYRGRKSSLPALLTSEIDSCLRYQDNATSVELTSDNPSSDTDKMYWYLVVGSNSSGDGPAGNGRIVNSGGSCQ